MNFELTGIAAVALATAIGVVVGWALCHLGHSRVRADAKHFRAESDVLRAKAIRFDESRLELQREREILVAEANLLRDRLGLAPMNEIGDLRSAVEARERELALADGVGEDPLDGEENIDEHAEVVDLTDQPDLEHS